MTLGAAELKRLAPLLDEALELEGAAREAWLERLAQDDAALAERLRRLLAAGMSTMVQPSAATRCMCAIEKAFPAPPHRFKRV